MSALLVSAAASGVLLVLVYAVWAGRIRVAAPADQQREAEERA